MNSDELFAELQSDAGGVTDAVNLYRRVLADRPFDLRLEVETRTLTRSIVIAATSQAVRTLPSLQGLDIELLTDGELLKLRIALRERPYSDLFSELVDDLLRFAGRAKDTDDPLDKVLERLTLWKRLFSDARGSLLTAEEQRGLFSELAILREVIVPSIGITRAVQAWTGPLGLPQDFRTTGVAVEVKSRFRKGNTAVRISSEEQLDSEPGRALFLAVCNLDTARGSTLNEFVTDMRIRFSGEPLSAVEFEDRLMQYGYLTAHQPSYDAPRYEFALSFYEVAEGFPRIRPDDLPTGVSRVAYDVSLADCVQFAVGLQTLRQVLEHGGTSD